MSGLPLLPLTCNDDQFTAVIKQLQASRMLTDNQKAYYVEQLQKQYAQIVIQQSIDKVCQEREEDIILREKRRRED